VGNSASTPHPPLPTLHSPLHPSVIEVDNNADYGKCASRSIVLTGPMFTQTDVRLSKRTKIVGRTDIEFAMEMLNAFNQANFVPVGIGSSSQAGQPLGNSISSTR